MRKFFFLFLNSDLLLQHIWSNHRQACPPHLQDYQALIELVKLTPRQWNPTVKVPDMLKYLTWTLGLSINLIGFKFNTARYNTTFQCQHTRACFLPYYKFQNTYARFNKESGENFFQINILEIKTEYFAVSSTSCRPILINQRADFDFHYESEPVTLHDINAILQNKPMASKSFSITLYSTSSFVRMNHTNIITRSVVGHLPPSSSENKCDGLHLFLTPHLHDSTFDVHQLALTSKNIEFNPKNVYSNTHITEGKYNFKKTPSDSNKTMLNQDHCICEHPDTIRYYAPNKNTFKPLGESQIFIPSYAKAKTYITVH